MANGGSIKYTVGFNVDKSGLNQIKASLQELQNLTHSDLKMVNANATTEELNKIKKTAKDVELALEKAFNPNLGTLNISKFNQELKRLDVQRVYNDFSEAGQAGQNAFRNITSDILTTNMKLKQSHSLLDNIATTMSNTIKWGLASSVMNTFTGSVQKAYGYVKSLDSSLNDIVIVTGKSSDEMAKFAVQANKAAKELAASTTNYTDASLIYYQQGLTDAEVAARAEVTLKAANVTGQSADAVSEQLTAVWNGYKVSAEEAELYIDKLAAVAATTASDLEELSVGMSKVASAANIMGVDADQLNAQLATIVATTRQAPESVGTALKTIYARMGDIEAGLDGETSLGHYTAEMEKMGFNVLDANGKLRDMGDVIEEIGGKWNTMSREQQVALSQTMAGTRQYNNLLSLFDNWDMYTKALDTSANSAGTLQEQQERYMERTSAHLQMLRTSTEDVYDSLFDPKGFNKLIDGVTSMVDVFGNFIDAIGGGTGALLLLGSVGTQVFSKQIASGLATTIMNFVTAKENAAQLNAEMEILNQFENAKIDDSRTQHLIAMKRQQLDLTKSLTVEERNISNEFIKQQNELYKEKDALDATAQEAIELYEHLTGVTTSVGADGKGSADLGEKLKAEAKEFDEYITKTKDVKKAINELTVARREYESRRDAEKTSFFPNEDQSLMKVVEKNKESIQEYINFLEKLRDSNKLSAEDQEKLNLALDRFKEKVGDVKTANLENGNIIAEVGKLYKDSSESIGHTSQKINQLSGDMLHLSDNIKNNEANTETLTQRWRDFIQTVDLRNTIQNFTGLLSSIGQIAGGLRSLSQIGKIWNDNTLSTGEKFLQLTTSLTMGLPMLINGLVKTVTTYKTLSETIKDYIAVVNIKKAFDEKDLALTGIRTTKEALLAVFKKAGIKLTEEEIKKLNENTAAEILNNKATEMGIAGEALETAQTELNTIANEKNSASILKVIAAKTILNPIFWISVAAIGALTYIIWKSVKAHNADADAAKRAAESVKTLTERYKELKSAHDEFKNSLSGYESEVEGLKNLTKGTQEYKDALNSANDKAKELIETYGLYDKYQIGENGLIIIEQAALDELQAELEEKAKKAEDQSYSAKIRESQANLQNEETNKRRSLGRFADTSVYDEGATQRELTEAEFEKITDLVASANEKGIFGGQPLYEEISKNLNETQDKFLKDNLEAIFSEDNQKVFQDFVESTKEAAGAQKYFTEQIIGSQIDGTQADKDIKEAYTDSEGNLDEEKYNSTKQAVSAIMSRTEEGEAFNDRLAGISSKTLGIDNVADLNDLLSGEGINQSFTNKKDIALKYAEMLNFGDASTLSYKDGKVTNQQGEELAIDDLKVVINELANLLLTEKETENYNVETAEQQGKITNSILNIGESKAGKEFGVDFSSAIINAILNGTTELDLSSTFNRLDPNEVKNIQGLSGDEILELFGITPEMIEESAYGTAPQFLKAFRDGLSDYSEEDYRSQVNAEGEASAEKEGLDKEEFSNYRDALEDQLQLQQANGKEIEYNLELLNDGAETLLKLKRGIENLSSKWEEYNKVLKDGNSTALEKAQIIAEMRPALQDILDLTDEEFNLLSPGFVEDNLDLIDGVLNGVDGALKELKAKTADEYLLQITGKTNLSEVSEEIRSLDHYIANYDASDFTVNANINDSQFIDSCNAMIAAAGMTAEQAQEYFKRLGYNAKVVEVDKYDVTTDIIEYPIIGPEGYPTGEKKSMNLRNFLHKKAFALEYIAPDGTTTGGDIGFGKGPSNTGGGGGSKKAKKMDRLENTVDRYHDVNREIKQITNKYDKLNDSQKKLAGKDLIDNLNEQLDVLKEQVKLYEQKIELAKGEAKEIKKTLEDRGVKFDDTGDITNYINLLKKKEAEVNKLIDKYNAMDAEGQEGFQDTVDEAKEAYEELKEDIEKYEQLMNETIPGLEKDIQKALDKQIEIQVTLFTTEVEIRLDLSKAERDWNKFKKKIIDGIKEDDVLGNALADMLDFSSYYKESGKGIVQVLTSQIAATLDQLNQIDATGTSSIYGNDRAKALKDLEKYQEELMSNLEEVEDYIKDIRSRYLDMIDEAGEAFDEHIAQYEYITNSIESTRNIIQLLKGEDAYKDMVKYYELQEKNNKESLDFQKREVNFWKEKMLAEKEGSEAWKKYREEWQAATEELNAMIESSIDNLIAKHENAISVIFEELNKKLTGGSNLDMVANEWDLINRNADQYLDTVNAMFEIQDLEKKYQDALDMTDSLYAQNKINDVMNEQLAMLREKDKLTQYDVDKANAIYDITVKRIALEEALQNKSKMRLRRDSQGNYTYQYVSDQEEIKKAQDDLDKSNRDLWNLIRENTKENQKSILDASTELTNNFQEIMTDTTLTDDERQKKLDQLKLDAIYLENLLKENDILAKDLEWIFAEMDEEFNLDELLAEVLPQMGSEVQNLIETLKQDNAFEELFGNAFDASNDALKDFNTSLEEVEKSSGVDLDNINENLEENIDITKDFMEDNETIIKGYEDQIDIMKAVQDELDALITKYENAKQAAIGAAEAAKDYLEEAKEEEAKAATDSANEIISSTDGKLLEPVTNISSSVKNIEAYLKESNEKYLSELKKQQDILNPTPSYQNYGYSFDSIVSKVSTENILSSIENSLKDRLSLLQNKFNTVSAENNGLVIEQKVSIEAKFEGQTESTQIENALINLVNYASQHAYDTKR